MRRRVPLLLSRTPILPLDCKASLQYVQHCYLAKLEYVYLPPNCVCNIVKLRCSVFKMASAPSFSTHNETLFGTVFDTLLRVLCRNGCTCTPRTLYETLFSKADL